MNHSLIHWYSISRELATEEHGAIQLEEALKIAERYLARADEKFEWGEDAQAATMFGFSRSKTEFIEITVNGPALISCRFEFLDPDASWWRRFFKGGIFEHEEELHSREALLQRVVEFFNTSGQEIMRRIENR